MEEGTEPPGHRRLRWLELKAEFNTEQDDVVADFYAPCLAVSSRYDRAVGYFRANIYRELGEPLLNFVLSGGHVRIVCSPDLPAADENAARNGYESRGARSSQQLQTDLVRVLRSMERNPDESDCLEMLRLLVEEKALDLFIAVRPGGIYHRKVGLFEDKDGDHVVFSGSGNETEPAVSAVEDWANDEEFDVFRSWGDEFERTKAARKRKYLEGLFAGGTEHTRVRPINEVERKVLEEFRRHATLEECRPGARKRGAHRESSGVNPYYYQMQAIKAWEDHDRVGIIAMATGTGKTITALSAIRPLVAAGRPIVIVVPSKLLIDQWSKEFRRIYPGVPLLVAGGGFDWRADVGKRMYVSNIARPRAILATMQTARSDDFLEYLGQAQDPVLVADEVHRLGSAKNRKLLEIRFACKLGLSATPERLFDPEGTEALANAFGARPVYDLPIGGKVRLSEHDQREISILGRFLSRYRYDFETLTLSASEQTAWDELTLQVKRRIARMADRGGASRMSDPQLQLLLIQRSRIVKKAAQKLDVAEKVIRDRYPVDGRWIVYCEDETQLDSVCSRLRQVRPDVAILKYHSKMTGDERTNALAFFEKNPSVIVAIRCLDEGVDIPAADGGLILASSTNPREYVQRRGRLLRVASGKGRAEIVDAIVLPRRDIAEDEAPDPIVRGEVARGYNFALNADNPEVTHRLWKICQDYHVNPTLDADVGYEVDDPGDPQ